MQAAAETSAIEGRAWLGGHTLQAAAESALYGMAEDKCEMTDLITAAAGPEMGAAATMMIEEAFAEQKYFCLSAEYGTEEELSFGSRSPVGLHVREVESPPVTVQDVRKSEYQQVWLSAMHAELEGHKSAGTFATDEIPQNVNVITAKWVFGWKTDSHGLITTVRQRLG